eukprot:s4991_g1.t2
MMIGQTVRKGNGLSMYNAEFRSGSAEIPLILSIKNSQTETTMYVRNIPMSAVLDRGGLQQRWVAVYPPGDPLNLHFDPMQLPRDGSPQVCLSVAVHEDLLATVANLPVDDPFASAASSSAFGSWRFSPEPRPSEAVPASDKVDQLRRSITSLQAEMKLSQDRGDNERGVAFARQSLLSVAGGSHHGSRSSPGSELPGSDLAPWPSIAKNKVELDSWLKEKERQAQKIKEHVEDMAKAQRRAEDVGRNLQEQLDLLAELRRRSRSTEAPHGSRKCSFKISKCGSGSLGAMGAVNCTSSGAASEKDTQLVFDLQSHFSPVFEPPFDPLNVLSEDLFDDKVMGERLPGSVVQRFKECLITGAPTAEEDMTVIADMMFAWARERGAIDFSHWFFPMRGGGGAVGGMLGAYKQDTLIDLEFASKFTTKPMKATLPSDRLFQGETDGSSFPNGGLRVTHSAAAFTTWDRSSPPFVLNKTLYIPCAFITHFGKCIDEKTPLLRSMDAVKKEGLRLLKAAGLGKGVQTIYSYLGWEQEFFVIKAEHYKARPDLVNAGRTLFGKLPTRHQQGGLHGRPSCTIYPAGPDWVLQILSPP